MRDDRLNYRPAMSDSNGRLLFALSSLLSLFIFGSIPSPGKGLFQLFPQNPYLEDPRTLSSHFFEFIEIRYSMKKHFLKKSLVTIGVFKHIFSGMPFALFSHSHISNILKGRRMDLFKKLQEFRILLVDDDESIRDSLRLFFQGEGCDLNAVRTAEEAIEALTLEDYDIIISDFRLPGMDGIELFNRMKKSHPRAMKILITAYGSEELAASAMRMGIDDFIQKPLTTNAIEASLAGVLQRYEARGDRHPGREKSPLC